MKQYALSLVANKSTHTGVSVNQIIHHEAVTLYAVSKDEAIGKGFQLIHKSCPTEDDWQGHDVIVIEIEVKNEQKI